MSPLLVHIPCVRVAPLGQNTAVVISCRLIVLEEHTAQYCQLPSKGAEKQRADGVGDEGIPSARHTQGQRKPRIWLYVAYASVFVRLLRRLVLEFRDASPQLGAQCGEGGKKAEPPAFGQSDDVKKKRE